ncbi:MAG TPA: ComEC/Rec2 family competence protein [Clostridia bacterium]|nr:ComEC/Rec2 family competence protein [Clostridia bacterium]HOL61400.1 ComEC/Rec2 family competence protein [Clostridia bacterium]HPO54164.1 ComEC/Rec2 family competence protein [Clostridia bacterium]
MESYSFGSLPPDAEQKNTVFGGALNYRIPVFAAVSMMAGIALSAALYFNGTAKIICYALLGLFLIVGIALAVLKKRLYLPVALFLLLGFFIYDAQYSIYATGTYETENAVITGRVSRVERDFEDYHVYLIKDIRIDGATAKGGAYIYTKETLFVGTGVSCLGKLYTFDWDPYNYVSVSHRKNGVKHIMYADRVNIIPAEKKSGIFENIREKIKFAYETNLGQEEAGIALSLVLGDKSLLTENTNEYFMTSGLLHIFSVSGLHVGFLAAVISFICKKTRLGRYAAFGISLAAMIIYAFITGFAPGMVRAIVMTASFYLGFLLFRRTDKLNSLALAAVIVLLINPMSLFEIGFQLSFTAVLGIICYYRPLKRALSFGKTAPARFVTNSLAMSLSANSMLFAVSANAFSVYGVYFCLANLVVVPIVSILYALLMFATITYLVFPSLGFLISVFNYPFMAITCITRFIASLPGALAGTSGLGLLAFVYVLTLFFMSRYVMIPQKIKYRALLGIIGFSLVYAIVFL